MRAHETMEPSASGSLVRDMRAAMRSTHDRGSRIDAALRAQEETASHSEAADAEPGDVSGTGDADGGPAMTVPSPVSPTPPRAPPPRDARRRPRPGAPPPQQPMTYADRAERERVAAAADADRRRAALQASGVDLALPQVRAGREPTVRNTRGGESLKPVHFGVDDATAAAIGKGARELSARRRGSKGAAAAEAGAWNSKFLARYGLDKTLR